MENVTDSPLQYSVFVTVPALLPVIVEAAELGDMNLEQYVVEDHSLGDVDSLAEAAAFSGDLTEAEYAYETIGGYVFLKVFLNEHSSITEYYVLNDGTVVSFSTIYSLGFIEGMLETLEFE